MDIGKAACSWSDRYCRLVVDFAVCGYGQTGSVDAVFGAVRRIHCDKSILDQLRGQGHPGVVAESLAFVEISVLSGADDDRRLGRPEDKGRLTVAAWPAEES